MAASPLFPTVPTTSPIYCKSLQITTITVRMWAKCGHESSRQTPTLTNRPHQQSIHRIADGIQIIIKQIRIHVQGHDRALMPQLPLHCLDIRASMDQQRRARVAQIVNRHRVRDLVTETALLRPVKPARRAAGPVRLAQIRAGAPVGKKQVGLPTSIAGFFEAWSQQAREDDGAPLPPSSARPPRSHNTPPWPTCAHGYAAASNQRLRPASPPARPNAIHTGRA